MTGNSDRAAASGRRSPAAHQLLLLRHTKSSRDDASLDDHDRPLAKRGRRDAAAIAEYLVHVAIVPDLVLCSTSLRTRATLEPILIATRPRRTIFSRDLYLAPASMMLRQLRETPEADRTVLMIGHNPGLHDLALMLADTETLAELPQPSEKLPTGALVRFTFATAWRHLAPNRAHVADYATPRGLADREQ